MQIPVTNSIPWSIPIWRLNERKHSDVGNRHNDPHWDAREWSIRRTTEDYNANTSNAVHVG